MPWRHAGWHDRRVSRRLRTVTPALPAELGEQDGLAYSLWLPAHGAPRGGVVILHGAGSCKESHYDFARAAIAAGLAAVAFDQRGHGDSAGSMGSRVLEDVASITELLRRAADSPSLPVALRGSSMGGYLAILAAPLCGARAVIAICPASAEGLAGALRAETLRFAVDRPAFARFLHEHDLHAAVAALDVPLLLLHAQGDEQVPVRHSRELAAAARAPGSRLVTVPGGHHRSVQHDLELQALSLRFLARHL